MTAPEDAPAVVLDTNVVLDWLVFRNAKVEPLARAIGAGALRWLATVPMRDELARMLAHRSLQRWQPDTERVLTVFDSAVELCSPAAASHLLCSDADDQMFINLALAQQARWLFTRDKALLKLARPAAVRGTRIVVPAAQPGTDPPPSDSPLQCPGSPIR
jgi:putative PIN family toxin of toxin-antitoxin system